MDYPNDGPERIVGIPHHYCERQGGILNPVVKPYKKQSPTWHEKSVEFSQNKHIIALLLGFDIFQSFQCLIYAVFISIAADETSIQLFGCNGNRT